MNSLIPYEFCGKSIRKNPRYDKIPINQQGNILPGNIYFEIGRNILETDSCNEILWSWMGKYSHNQYLNFLCLVSKFAEKIKCDVATVFIGIDEIGRDNFFKCMEDITVKEIAKKVNNNDEEVITLIEYALLKSIPIKRGALHINKKEVWVKKTLMERYCPTSEQFVNNIALATFINIPAVAIVFRCGILKNIEESKHVFITAELLDLLLYSIADGLQNNSPTLKPYEPTIID